MGIVQVFVELWPNEVCDRWTMEEKERKKEIEEDHRKVEELVPRCFHKWKRVFGKVKSKRMPIRKPWDHAIDLRKDFVPRKE